MRTHVKLFAVAASVVLTLMLGCGGSPHPYTLISLTPSEAVASSSDFTLVLSGSNFTRDTKVVFAGAMLTPTVVTPTYIQVTIPASAVSKAGLVSVAVTGSSTSQALTFTIKNPLPLVSGISQESALLNSGSFSLEIAGSNFVTTSTVQMGDMSLVPKDTVPTKLTVLVPDELLAAAQTLPVKVVNPSPGGGNSNPVQFTVNNPLPVISSLSATKALVNSEELSLDIAGSGFASGVTVNFGTVTLTPTSVSPTQISVLVPKELLSKSGILSVSATNVTPGGGASNALEFAVENPVPTLTSISLDNIVAGTGEFVLTLTGTNFIESSSVGFGSVELVPSASSPTELTITVPDSALQDGGVYPVLVSNRGPGGGASNALSFTVNNPLPVLTALSQQSVALNSPAFTLQLFGSGFVHQSAVFFGTTELVPSSITSTQIEVLVPETALVKAGRLNVNVFNPTPGGGTSASMRFTIQNPVPQLTTASPTSITTSTKDTSVILMGEGFAQDATVTLAGEPVTALSTTSTDITVMIPSSMLASSGTLTFKVSNPEPGGGQSNDLSVTVHGKAPTNWRTVVNNKMTAPGTTQLFNSYNQASVNRRGVVVFKGQTKADSGPVVGIYVRDMSAGQAKPLVTVAKRGMEVPQPNNTSYNGALATFIQFPSFPRIDMDSDTVAVRGQSQPVWTYALSDGTESRIGSAGIFTNPQGSLVTGLSLMGSVPGFDYFQVPGAPLGTRFDQFPGSPAVGHVAGNSTIIFKGNYTLGDAGRTGVFYRDLVSENGKSPVQLIADNNTLVPGQPEGGTTFGSTAPPSAANETVVFVGLDNEEEPTMGGIYSAPVAPSPSLETVVAIGTQVPGEADGVAFNRIGEGLSFDGRYIGFWAAWGTEMRSRLLICGVDGNKEMLASCKEMYPDGYTAQIPVHQGIFVYDKTTKTLIPIAKTDGGEFSDFMYWVFSGRPPNTGGGSDAGGGSEGGEGEDVVPEPPRWRSSSFIAVAGRQIEAFEVAFKAMTGTVDGIYLVEGNYDSGTPQVKPIQTVVDTTSPGPDLDPDAPTGSTIATVGIERDGLRGDLLVVTSSMLDAVTGESGAGISVTQVMPQ